MAQGTNGDFVVPILKRWIKNGGLLPNNLIIVATEQYDSVKTVSSATTALVPLSVPKIKITEHGVLALRLWRFTPDGLLQSVNHDTLWREQMVADEPPNEENNNGLYGTEFSLEGLMRYGSDYVGNYSPNVFGLIQMRGKCKIHADCIMRGEWARIVCLFVPAKKEANEIVLALIKNYPGVPVYVLHRKQIAEVLFNALCERRQHDDQCAD